MKREMNIITQNYPPTHCTADVKINFATHGSVPKFGDAGVRGNLPWLTICGYPGHFGLPLRESDDDWQYSWMVHEAASMEENWIRSPFVTIGYQCLQNTCFWWILRTTIS